MIVFVEIVINVILGEIYWKNVQVPTFYSWTNSRKYFPMWGMRRKILKRIPKAARTYVLMKQFTVLWQCTFMFLPFCRRKAAIFLYKYLFNTRVNQKYDDVCHSHFTNHIITRSGRYYTFIAWLTEICRFIIPWKIIFPEGNA